MGFRIVRLDHPFFLLLADSRRPDEYSRKVMPGAWRRATRLLHVGMQSSASGARGWVIEA
ncbi:hypothetical protein Taro_014379 [Colocasia esculenta]|uniref:Uncharacterized protein n=1 Tax=Colocasia esculenta TaxID=4460 RepID=A0A843UJ79_COLES|nr:hypothetical protein [Colocasia esculenta]